MVTKEEVFSSAKSSGSLSKQPAEFLEALLSPCNIRRHAAGQIICNVGDRYAGMFGLVSGVMKMEFATAGQDLKIATVKQGNFWFGQASSLAREAHTVTVTVTTDATILYLSHAKFEEIDGECISQQVFRSAHGRA